jgi:hypothetical protein
MILADGINLPLVLLWGLATVGPLTLIVVAVELLIFRGMYRVPVRVALRPVLVGNILSTAAGLLVYMFQDGVLHALEIQTAADFARLYLPAALLLIALYFVVSVIVEGMYIARQNTGQKLLSGRGRLWSCVLAANMASYLVMGPVFYFSTRPTFHGLQFASSPAEVANCSDTIYFIGAANQHLYRVQADGHGVTEVVPHTVREFLVSADHSAFVYRGADGNLWFFELGTAQPTCIWQTSEEFLITEVDLSIDKARVAYASLREVIVHDVAEARIVARTALPVRNKDWHPVGLVAWDADDPQVLHLETVDSTQHAWRVEKGSLTPTIAASCRLVGNFRRCTLGSMWGGKHDWGVPLPAVQEQGHLSLHAMAGLGRHVWVGVGTQTLAMFHNDYGLLGFGGAGPDEACFLSAPGIVLCGGSDCIYVLNVEQKSIAELARGHRFVVAVAQFQASLSAGKSQPHD